MASAVGAVGPDVTTRPDGVSAMASAKDTDHRVEDLSKRSETTRVFANPDGTWTSDTANEPERVQDDQGQWHNIDTSLVPVEGGFAPKHAIGDLVVSSGGDKRFASIESDGRDLGWSWPTSLPTPIIDGPSATYPNAVEGGDLVVTAVPTGFRHDIVLRERPTGPVSFAIPIITGGPKVAEETSGEVSIETRAGEELATATKPVMYSLEQPAGDPESSTPVDPAELAAPEDAVTVDATVTSNATGGVLTLKPDTAFLTDPDTTYPVVIDPTVRIYPSGDTWVGSGTPTSIHPYDDTIKMGTPDGGSNKYRSFIRFPASTEAWYGQDVVSARMYLWNFDAKKCGPAGQMNVHRVTTDIRWSELTWNNQPSATSTYMASTTAAYGYSSACPSNDVSVDLTDVTQQWADKVPNYGVRLSAATETYTPSYRAFRSASYTTAAGSTGLRPRLVVTYDRLPSPPTDLTVSGRDADGFIASSTPTLSARFADPDGQLLSTYFQIWDAADTSQPVYSTAVTQSAANSTVSTSVPSGILVDGNDYVFKAYSTNSSGSSAVSELDFSYADPAQLNEQRAFEVAPQEVTQADSEHDLTFTSPSPVDTELAANGNASVKVIDGADLLGSYELSATDAAGNAVAFTSAVQQDQFTLSVAKAATTTYPVAVVSSFVPNLPTETIDESADADPPSTSTSAGTGPARAEGTSAFDAGCKTKSFKQKYGLGYTFYGLEWAVRWCWTSGTAYTSKNRRITGNTSAWANFNNQVQNDKGPTNSSRITIDSAWQDSNGSTTVYFWFQSRSCATGNVGLICSSWAWHKIKMQLYAGGGYRIVSRS